MVPGEVILSCFGDCLFGAPKLSINLVNDKN
jgi:hypothetical protein